ncbi:uncharacterized protein LOC143377571 [Andrena cerasifolii]|uniref:uncharacterized protein LOC143377571 n=1 Tax=Andrena cerasifolii TaxID=2819439 RepID=UPI004037F366
MTTTTQDHDHQVDTETWFRVSCGSGHVGHVVADLASLPPSSRPSVRLHDRQRERELSHRGRECQWRTSGGGVVVRRREREREGERQKLPAATKKEEEERKKWRWTSTVKRMLSCDDKRPRGVSVHCCQLQRKEHERMRGLRFWWKQIFGPWTGRKRKRRLRIGSGGCLDRDTKKLLNNRRGGARGERECRRRGIKRVEREKSIRNGGTVREDRRAGAQRSVPCRYSRRWNPLSLNARGAPNRSRA